MRLILLAFLLFSQTCYSQSTLLWKNDYPLNFLNFSNVNFTSIQDNQGNTYVAVPDQQTPGINLYDPRVFGYDAAGNLVLDWINPDTLVSEVYPTLAADSTGMIYLLTHCFGTVPDQTALVKLNPSTQQEEFRFYFPAGNAPSNFVVKGNRIYLYQTEPLNQLLMLDLQGNLIQTMPAPFFHRIENMLVSKDYIYIVGDSIDSSFTGILKFARLDLAGNLVNELITSLSTNLYIESKVNQHDELLYTYHASPEIRTVYVDSAFNYNMSGINSIAVSASATFDNLNSVFLAYKANNLLNLTELFQIPPPGPLASIDSANVDYNARMALSVDSVSDFILFNSESNFQSGNVSDYSITSFDSQGNFLWDFTLDNNSQDCPRFIYLGGGAVYGVGLSMLGNNNLSICVFKIGYSTGIPEPLKSNLQFYPNPLRTNQLNINSAVTAYYSLFSLNGQLLQEGELQNSDKIILNSDLQSGTYILRLKNEKISTSYKLCYIKE